MSAFDLATAVVPDGTPGGYAAAVDETWNAPMGPNGGYLAAIVLRAMTAATGDDGRAPRSLTVHYLRPPKAGPVRVEVTVEREGRSLSTLSARLLQDGRVCNVALGAFATPFPTAMDYERAPLEVPPADAVAAMATPPGAPPITSRVQLRPTLGPGTPGAGDQARAGGWLRLTEPHLADAPTVAFYTDAWLPSPFSILHRPAPAPTIDLTIHFRATLPLAHADPEASVLGVYSSGHSAEGFFEEDALIYDAHGVLLAQSRQHALLVPGR